jgi:hypothetical protein
VTDLPLYRSAPPIEAREQELLAQILECHLDAVVVEFLVIGSELFPAARASVEELSHDPDRRMRLALKGRRAADVDGAVKI